jgi:hypothetical protein
MECPNLEQMKRFDESNLPDLDVVVLAALELFMRQGVPRLDLGRCQKPLVVGSGNAAATGAVNRALAVHRGA